MEAPSLGMNTYTINMIPFFDQTKMAPVPTAFQAFYGRNQGKTIFSPDADEIDIDIRKGNKKTAKLVKRDGNIHRLLGPNQANVMEGNYTSIARAFPLSIEESSLSAKMKNKRVPGEPSVNSGWTAQMRLRYWAAEAHFDLYMRQVRLMERLAAQSILEGVQDAILDTSDVNFQYDMYRNAANTITIGTPWTTAATATPIEDIDAALTIISRNGDRMPKFACMGSAAIAAFTNTTEVRETADNRRYELVRCGQNVTPPSEYAFMIANGWTAWGWLRTYEGRTLWIFTQDYIYETDAGADTEYMPVNKVLFGSLNSRNDRYFGPSDVFEDTSDQLRFYQEFFGMNINAIPSVGEIAQNKVIDPRMFMLDAYLNNQNTLITTRCITAPLFATIETDAWGTIENAAA